MSSLLLMVNGLWPLNSPPLEGCRQAGWLRLLRSARNDCLLLLALLLTGCATAPTAVELPIPIPCSPPPAVERPYLAIRNLTPDTPPAEVLRAYLSSLEQMAGYAKELEALLDGYRKEASRGGSY